MSTEQWTQSDMLNFLGRKREPATSLSDPDKKIIATLPSLGIDLVNQLTENAGLLLSVTIDIELYNGNGGRGFHWRVSAARRKNYEAYLIRKGHRRTPFAFPIRLVITRILGPKQRAWDADSILRGSAKELIDAIVAVGWLHDDCQEWLTGVTGVQDDSQRQNGPAVRVDVFHSA